MHAFACHIEAASALAHQSHSSRTFDRLSPRPLAEQQSKWCWITRWVINLKKIIIISFWIWTGVDLLNPCPEAVDIGFGACYDGVMAGDGGCPAYPGRSRSVVFASQASNYRSQSYGPSWSTQHPTIVCWTQSSPIHLSMDERPLRRTRFISFYPSIIFNIIIFFLLKKN